MCAVRAKINTTNSVFNSQLSGQLLFGRDVIDTFKSNRIPGKRKDKKDKKDRGYAALDGESSPEEDHDTKYGQSV